MDDFESLSQAPAEDNRSGSIHLFLALYLLVLAFFIVLVTISTREEIKSQAVKDSLTTTFTTILPVRGEPAPFASRAGDFVGSPAFEGMITDVFSAAISINKVTVIQPGSVMRVSMPSDSLFLSGESTLREAQHPLLDRIVAALSGRPAVCTTTWSSSSAWTCLRAACPWPSRWNWSEPRRSYRRCCRVACPPTAWPSGWSRAIRRKSS